MKTSTAFQISFANAFADLYLDKENGEFALDFRRQEVTIYLNNTQYQALVLLVQQSLEDDTFIEYLDWQKDPLQCDETQMFEVCGPDHMVCMSCSPNCERVKLTFDIGLAIDLSFADFQGLASLIKEAQADLEWRRELLRLNNADTDVDDADSGPGFAAGGQD
ncbi:hypothetical protein KBI23_07635 [bacterium]|jgi:hypothetical protein|nr:hypothetical protein [Cyanobacteria bacterium PR.023]MBP6746455.1 hypothetical protein [bacterium]MDP3510925.1 hypothetical protein [Candidatus Melainabacteria bacterium]MDQ5936259.1 Delta-aminolevulinic acid dehydratase [Cyanobacteriota bacterium erpe_2018_sw_21hr_WHONDRS-SW48-000092_B_bin.40]MBP9090886.1 hypothetical protein [bacterium]